MKEFCDMMIGVPVGQCVLDRTSGEPLFTTDGRAIVGLGRWRAHGSLINFRSAISVIHGRRVCQSREFKVACPDCIINRGRLAEAEVAQGMTVAGPSQWNGCETHPSNPRLMR